MHYGKEARLDASAIAAECITHGESTGWSGTEEQQKAVAEVLRPFGIAYVDDMFGTWRHRPVPLYEVHQQ